MSPRHIFVEEVTQQMYELPNTERRDPASALPDEMSAESVLRLMNEEDREVPEAVDLLVEARREGRRWIYVGAGTSGRIAVLDAARPALRPA